MLKKQQVLSAEGKFIYSTSNCSLEINTWSKARYIVNSWQKTKALQKDVYCSCSFSKLKPRFCVP